MDMALKKTTQDVFVENLNMLIEAYTTIQGKRGDAITKLAKGACDIRAINHYLVKRSAPTITTLEGIAKNAGVESWQLLIPDLTIEMAKRASFKSLIKNYQKASDDNKKFIEMAASTAAKH